MTLGRTLELALLVDHAQWCIASGHEAAPRMAAAARRFAFAGVDQVNEPSLDDTRLLV
jgi:hypothetical protein